MNWATMYQAAGATVHGSFHCHLYHCRWDKVSADRCYFRHSLGQLVLGLTAEFLRSKYLHIDCHMYYRTRK